MEKEAKQMIDLKRNLFKIDVRAQKDEEKVFMRTACINLCGFFIESFFSVIIKL
ncbi:hypothetical protein MGAS9429_Spy1156 [Streptococcus pyogenes MGAS9429]|uniref:Exfoliative toxin n=1 Tax=Streptococcus pyogenes serotype M12 (strain MGAS9429) TaxID=370551 RepID=Q1JL76_STRPC|nr:hypothetical protein MGAS9429_Spy1156 [Streptococcus pyogenes MGAS9429]